MKLYLLDYSGNKHEVEIEIDKIKSAFISVVSGDEILTVVMKNDNQIFTIDPAEGRMMNFFDGKYEIFDEDSLDNLIFDEMWLNRENPYQGLWHERARDEELRQQHEEDELRKKYVISVDDCNSFLN